MNAPLSNDHQFATVYPIRDLNDHPGQLGLTKRELIAAMAMQGWLAGCRNAYSEFTGLNTDVVACQSVKLADALLSALDVPK